MLSRLSLIPPLRDGADDFLKLHDGVSTDTREITIVASPLRPAGQDSARDQDHGGGTEPLREVAADLSPGRRQPSQGAGLEELLGGGSPRRPVRPAGPEDRDSGRHQDHDADLPERQPGKPKRSTVPSWDEIVFGTKRE